MAEKVPADCAGARSPTVIAVATAFERRALERGFARARRCGSGSRRANGSARRPASGASSSPGTDRLPRDEAAVAAEVVTAGIALRGRALPAAGAGLVSFGVASGLDPALARGTLLVPRAVLAEEGRRFEVDAAWHEAALEALADFPGAVATGELAQADRVLASAAEKARLFRSGGACSADMESALLAARAAQRGLRFLAVRIVSDDASRAIPGAVAGAIGGAGAISWPRMLALLARRPGELGAFLRLAADALAARPAMVEAAARLAGVLSNPP